MESQRPDGKTADGIRRAYVRVLRLNQNRKQCSSCKEKKSRVRRYQSVQLCEDCVKRIQEKYGTA